MGFLPFYLLALLPVMVACVLLAIDRRFTWHEWVACTLLSLLVAGGSHLLAISGMTADEETWSGHVTSVRHVPRWVERYMEAVYVTETDSKGNTSTRFSHFETRYDTHPEHWVAHSQIGDFRLDRAHHAQLVERFGGKTVTVKGDRSGSHGGSLDSGDPNDYVTANATGVIEPVAKSVSFVNRVKATPSVFSYRSLPEAELARLPSYPYTKSPWSTGRSIKSGVNNQQWDELNGRLGPVKHVNLILVRLSSADESRDLEAAWVGGKKNDLVLTYGDGWARVFGWTESSLVKRNLEALLTEHPVDASIIPLVHDEVMRNYVKTNWHRFDYLDLEPRWTHYLTMIVLQIVLCGAAFAYSLTNDLTKDGLFGWVTDSKFRRRYPFSR